MKNKFELLRCLIHQAPIPTRDDWREIFRPISYIFSGSLQARAFQLSSVLLLSLALWQMAIAILSAPEFFESENGVIFLLGLVPIGVWLVLIFIPQYAENSLIFFLVVFIFPALTLFGLIASMLGGNAVISIIVGGLLTSAFILAVSKIEGSAPSKFGEFFLLALGIFISVCISNVLTIQVDGFFSAIINGLVIGVIFCIVGLISGETLEEVFPIAGGIGLGLGLLSVNIEMLIFFPTRWLYTQLEWQWTCIFWATWVAWTVSFLYRGFRLERRAKNPLQKLLDIEIAPEIKDSGLKRLGFTSLPARLTFFLTKK